MIGDNTCRVIIYSLGNTAFADDDSLLSIKVYAGDGSSEDSFIRLNNIKMVFEAETGIYIVRVGTTTAKVIIR